MNPSPMPHRCLLASIFLLTLPLGNVTSAEQPAAFKLVNSKTEATGYHNVMEIYACNGALDVPRLKQLCVERKEKSSAEVFFYVVVFDDAAHATFPKSPFTAEFGLEEDALKHIRAIYTFNRVNGLSRVRYHEKNLWEYVAKEEKL